MTPRGRQYASARVSRASAPSTGTSPQCAPIARRISSSRARRFSQRSPPSPCPGPNTSAVRCWKMPSRALTHPMPAGLWFARDQLAFVGGLPVAENDEGLRALAPPVVRDADHRGVDHGRVAQERLLDLDRGDVLTAGD